MFCFQSDLLTNNKIMLGALHKLTSPKGHTYKQNCTLQHVLSTTKLLSGFPNRCKTFSVVGKQSVGSPESLVGMSSYSYEHRTVSSLFKNVGSKRWGSQHLKFMELSVARQPIRHTLPTKYETENIGRVKDYIKTTYVTKCDVCLLIFSFNIILKFNCNKSHNKAFAC